MVWITGLLLLLFLLLCWLLLSSLNIEIDSRVPRAGIKWGTIGSAKIWYDEKWRMHIRAPFYEKTSPLAELKGKSRKIIPEEAAKKKEEKKRRNLRRVLKMIIPMVKTFRVTEWKLALDTGDYSLNASLYPINFLPYTINHILVNFQTENYLVLKVRNRPWKILIVFLKSIF
jgi:hypothetical protein